MPKKLACTTSRASPAIRDSAVASAKMALFTASRRRPGDVARRRSAAAAGGGPGVLADPICVLSDGHERAIVRAVAAVTRAPLVMANIHSQKKRILRAERERLENRRYTSTIKTYFRRLETAVAEGQDDVAETEHRVLVRTIDKAVKRGALHRNNGARKKSRAARLRRGA